MKPTVCFDFDGVIHSYLSGWQGVTTIQDPPVPGIREALSAFQAAGYRVVINSTRCDYFQGRRAIVAWLVMYNLSQFVDDIVAVKPPAVAYIDDRAICFDGHPDTLLEKVQRFQPWNAEAIAERRATRGNDKS